MTKRSGVIVLILALALCVVFSACTSRSSSQSTCADPHCAWVANMMQKMQFVKPGMTRKDLLTVFRTEGGLSTGLQRKYVDQECPLFKVDVEFQAVGRRDHDDDGRVTLIEDYRDIIVKISKPYLESGIYD